MGFHEEPRAYEKTIISDLQGSWGNLLETVIEEHPFPGSKRLLFHIHEGMSWESVRNLAKMRETLLVIRNLAEQGEAPEAVREWVNGTWDTLKEALEVVRTGRG